MKPTKKDLREMASLIKTLNLVQYNILQSLEDVKLYDKILWSLCNIDTMCKKYGWDFQSIILSDSLIENLKGWTSFKCPSSLAKFKTVFDNAEEKYKQLNVAKTKVMRKMMDDDPSLCDTQSLVFFEKKYGDPEIAAEKYKEYHENRLIPTKLEYWKAKGLSDIEAREELRKRQVTFSLDVCIEKHGEIEGRIRWEERQRKWQSSLGNIEFTEQLLLNFKKGSTAYPENAAYFISVPIEKYSDELFRKTVLGKDEYFKIIAEKFTTEFSDYSKITRELSSKTYNKYKDLIDPNGIRSKEWHLDHKFSVFSGFVNKVSPEIISHVCNLEMIPASENCSKQSKCSLTLNELIEKCSEFNNTNQLDFIGHGIL